MKKKITALLANYKSRLVWTQNNLSEVENDKGEVYDVIRSKYSIRIKIYNDIITDLETILKSEQNGK